MGIIKEGGIEMAFRDDIKIKDYFMKDYSREEILRTFTFILKRIIFSKSKSILYILIISLLSLVFMVTV